MKPNIFFRVGTNNVPTLRGWGFSRQAAETAKVFNPYYLGVLVRAFFTDPYFGFFRFAGFHFLPLTGCL